MSAPVDFPEPCDACGAADAQRVGPWVMCRKCQQKAAAQLRPSVPVLNPEAKTITGHRWEPVLFEGRYRGAICRSCGAERYDHFPPSTFRAGEAPVWDRRREEPACDAGPDVETCDDCGQPTDQLIDVSRSSKPQLICESCIADREADAADLAYDLVKEREL